MASRNLQLLRTIILLSFVATVFGLLVYSRIMAYSLAPTMKPIDLRRLDLLQIPVVYVLDYLSHGWICLLFAFVTAGLLYEFTPKKVITQHMGSSTLSGYLIASSVAPLFTVCSCTMVPLFAGILYTGSGIGPAIAFLLMAPAANILTILLTGEIISWEIAGVRIVTSLITAVSTGFIISRTPWGRRTEAEHSQVHVQQSNVSLVAPPLDERLWSAMRFAAYLGRQILPWFFLGLVAVSYLSAFIPEETVATYLTGFHGVFLASVIGGPLYTPTLVEIVLGRALLDLGMSRAALLSWLMGQPYDIPNMVATSRVVGWRIVITYTLLALAFSITSGLTYGVLTNTL